MRVLILLFMRKISSTNKTNTNPKLLAKFEQILIKVLEKLE